MSWDNLADTSARSKRGPVKYGGAVKTPIDNPIRPVERQTAGDFARTLVRQSAGLVSDALETTGKYVVNTPRYVYEGVKPFLNTTARVVTGQINADTNQINQQVKELDDQLQRYSQQYKSGKMSKQRWTEALKQHSEQLNLLSKAAKENTDALEKERRDVPMSAATTAATILLGGRLKLGSAPKAALRRTATATSKSKKPVLDSLINQNATKLEKAFMRVPATRDLVRRNLEYIGRREAQKLAGETTAQYVARESRALAVNMLFKRPILYEMNIQGANEIHQNILEGDYDDAVKQSAWLGTQMLSGGPLGAAINASKWLRNKGKPLAYGQGSVIDEISKQIGTKQASQIAERLQDLKVSNPKQFAEEERAWRVIIEPNLALTNGDATQAASRILQHWDEYGIKLDDVTPEKAFNLVKNWSTAHELKNTLIKGGKFTNVAPEDAGKYVVVRWDVDARKALANIFRGSNDDIQDIVDKYTAWRLAPGNAAGQNEILTNKIDRIINEAFQATDNLSIKERIAQKVEGLSAASVMTKEIPDKYKKKFAELGFAIARPSGKAVKEGKVTPATNYEDTRKLVTAAQNADNEVFDIANAPQPQLSFLARTAEKLGVSPVESNQVANRVLSQQVAADLNNIQLAKNLGFSTRADADSISGGQALLSKLQRYVEEKQPSKIGNFVVAGRAVGPAIHDIRQLTPGEIVEALGVTKSEAKAISSVIINAYAKVPMEYRGLGDKIVDNLYKFNPLQKYYSRIQSALRYTYNPFFRVQESVETAALSRATARTAVWNKSIDELDAGAKLIDEAGIFKTGLSGEAAQDLVLGRITATLTQGQKRNLSGLALNMAKARNLSLEEMLKRHPDEVGDALRVIVQYPNKGVLSSSLARTLNVAFFPMRYNAKVTKLAADLLAKEPPSVQVAVINSLFNLRDWLKSDEGIAWQRDNQEAIQVFNWITPVGSIKYGLEKLTHKPDSIGELGSLGGLPLGFITQMLDSQGLITINTPYVSPKTGDVLPRYIPETTKARAATAMGDLLNSMFTYPGRVLGLPGKQQTINSIVRQFIDTHGTDFEKRIDTDRLTPLQQNWIRVLKGDTSEEAIDALYNSPVEGQFNWYTLPPLDVPIRTTGQEAPQLERRTGLPKKASKSGKKEKNYALPITR